MGVNMMKMLNNSKIKQQLFLVLGAMFLLLFIIPFLLVLFERNDLFYNLTAVAILSTISSGVWLTFYMGRINIGQGAYALLGGYISAALISKLGFSFWVSILFSGLGAAAFAAILGVPLLRLRGVYFAMITLTLTEVMRLASFAFVPLTNGPRGITGLSLPGELSIFGVTIIPDFNGMENPKIGFYYLAVVVMIITFVIMWRLVHSRMGALLRSLQQNEELASSLGVNLSSLRVKAYAIASFFGGIGGAIFVAITQSVYPTTFQVTDSINYMLYTFLGGLNYVFGPIVGSSVLYFGWDFLFFVKEYQLLIYSSIMIVLILCLPNGLLSLPYRDWIKKLKKKKDEG